MKGMLSESKTDQGIDIQEVGHGKSSIIFATHSLVILGAPGSLTITGRPGDLFNRDRSFDFGSGEHRDKRSVWLAFAQDDGF